MLYHSLVRLGAFLLPVQSLRFGDSDVLEVPSAGALVQELQHAAQLDDEEDRKTRSVNKRQALNASSYAGGKEVAGAKWFGGIFSGGDGTVTPPPEGFNEIGKSFHEEEGEGKPLDEEDLNWLRRLLAAAAADVYYMEPHTWVGNPAMLKVKLCQRMSDTENIRWALYEIKFPNSTALHGKKILSVRGTAQWQNWVQNMAIGLGGAKFTRLIKFVADVAKKFSVDYVCGHSLGGAVAEGVAMLTGIAGMSFNGPVICSSTKHADYDSCDERTEGASPPFEVWLTKGDPVSYMTSWSKAWKHKSLTKSTEEHHIVKPEWINSCENYVGKAAWYRIDKKIGGAVKKHSLKCMLNGDREEMRPLPGATLEEDLARRTDHDKCKG